MVEIPKKGEMLLYFSAAWCGPCRGFFPLVERVCEAGGLPVIKIDIDKEAELTYSLGIRSVPTIKMFRDGNVLGTAIGAMTETQLKDWLNTRI